MNRRTEILAELEDVQFLSSPALGAIQLINDIDVDRDKLLQTLELDPALTMNILRFANSSYFGCSRQIHTVGEALVRLGQKTISRMLYTSVAAQLSRSPVRGYELASTDVWNHLISTAVITEILAKKTGKNLPAHTFTAALLHDVGQLILGTYLEVDFKPIMELSAQENIPFDEAEFRVLGINHAELGAALLQQWNLPEAIVETVRWHHEPNSCVGEQLSADFVHLADSIALMSGRGLGLDGLCYSVHAEAEERLGVDLKIIQQVMCEFQDEVEKVEQMV